MRAVRHSTCPGSVTLRREAAKLPSLEGRRPADLGRSSLEAGALRLPLRMTDQNPEIGA
jgi:hypothetical protein